MSMSSSPPEAHGSIGMHSLAAVELQLIVQCFSNSERLKAARCSKVILAAASHPFAWRHAAEHTVLATADAAEVDRVNASLLKHAPTGVRVSEQSHMFSRDEWTRLSNLTRLHLDSRSRPHCALIISMLDEADWTRHLRSLHIAGAYAKLLTMAQRMSQLTEVRCALGTDSPPEWLSALTDAPSLTSVTVRATEPDALLHPSRCRLLQLHLMHAHFRPGSLSRLFASPSLLGSSLQELTLDEFHAESTVATTHADVIPIAATELTAAFQSLTMLHTVCLQDCYGYTAIFAALCLSPTLRLLCVSPLEWRDWRIRRLDLRAAALRSLLDAAPLIHVQLQHCPNDDEQQDEEVDEDRFSEWRQMVGLKRVQRVDRT